MSRQHVHELVKKNVLTKDNKGLIDIEEAKQALLNQVRPGTKLTQNLSVDRAATEIAPSATPPDGAEQTTEVTSYHVAKTLREAAEAQMARIKLAEMKGEVIQVEAVRAAWARRLSATKDALLQIPIRIAPVLAAETNIEQVAILLDAELRQALAELSRDGAQTGHTGHTGADHSRAPQPVQAT